MSVFIFRRFLTLIATLVGASLIIFLVLDALPGNAAQMLMGADASPDAVRALMVKLGLDQPLHYRYVHWIKGLLTGDLGNSYAYGTPVAALIAERLVLTIPLAIMSMSMTVVLALSAGIYTAANHNKLGDVGVMSLTQFGIALPNFWFAILLDPAVLGEAAMAFGRRICGLGRKHHCRDQVAAVACDLAIGGAGGDPRTGHALRRA